MLNKILIILIFGLLVVSFIPIEASCDDYQNPTEYHHGIVVCHASCHGLADRALFSSSIPNNLNSSLQTANMFSLIYQNPTLDKMLRPPIYSL